MRNSLTLLALGCATALFSAPALAFPPGLVSDNGSGTAYMPVMADYTGEGSMQILHNLPPLTTIDMAAPVLKSPTVTGYEQAGGSLGGTQSAAVGSSYEWNMQGTGTLAGFNRVISIPLSGAVASFLPPAPLNPALAGQTGFEVHAAPRTNAAPVQLFDTDMFRLFGQITGDPDFDLLRIVAGTDFGMPSPGATKLTDVGGGNWQVDSFFDITYRIDFVGRPGSPLGGMSGSTTATIRMSMGNVPEPLSLGLLLPAAALLARRRI